MIYNPREYWGQPLDERQKAVIPLAAAEVTTLARTLRLLEPASVLKVGSGWGRVYVALKSLGLAGNVTLCDFTEHQRRRCLAVTGVEPDVWDGVTLPYEDDSFDLVLSFDVMLHVPPTDLAQFIIEHMRVTRRWLYVATLREAQGEPVWQDFGVAAHCFIHEYDFTPMHVVWLAKFGRRAHWLLEAKGEGEEE